MNKIFIKKSVEKNIMNGHPWCFSGAIEKIDNNITDGELCEVYCDKKFLGIGYYNSNTDIAIRILSRKKQIIDKNFFCNRFIDLKNQKEKFLSNTNSYRLVFGESDNLPGLVVDIYDKVCVIQIHTLGIEKLKNLIIEALIEVIKPESIYERSDIEIRKKEGLEKENKKLIYGKENDEIIIKENNFKFYVNVLNGQKTGFFLDQRENRNSIIEFCKNRNVLNCFCYTGGFSIYAASVAKSVTSVDISKPAIDYCIKNFKLNNFSLKNHCFVAEDAFDYLKNIEKNFFDIIILDPPSFAKNKNQINNAIKAYTTINSKALEKLPDYGILISSSCTTHINEDIFIKILHQSSVNTKSQLKVLKSNIQPLDHSYNLNFPEGRYLKFFILQKLPII